MVAVNGAVGELIGRAGSALLQMPYALEIRIPDGIPILAIRGRWVSVVHPDEVGVR